MCGIAGYNCSTEWMEQHIINNKIQTNILREAWLHNLHRGDDAAGFFALYEDKYYVYKDGKAADKILENYGKKAMPPTVVFGAHTRAATQGAASDNFNNHPVQFDGVMVTHNGMIRNDDTIMKGFLLPDNKSKVGPRVVDTIAIAALLSTVEPYDLDDVGEVLGELSGSFAIHAIWEEHPGLSILAKGSGSPMYLQYQDGFVGYSSEEEAVWHMVNEQHNLSANHDNWKWRDLRDGVVLLILDGEILDYRNFRLHDESSFTVHRMIGDKEIYSTKEQGFWAGKPELRSATIEDNEAECIYIGGEFSSDETIPTALIECDSVFYNKKPKLYYGFIGNLEIVVDEIGLVLDVYNHSAHDLKDRWLISEPDTIAPDADAFLINNSWEVKPPKSASKYKYLDKGWNSYNLSPSARWNNRGGYSHGSSVDPNNWEMEHYLSEMGYLPDPEPVKEPTTYLPAIKEGTGIEWSTLDLLFESKHDSKTLPDLLFYLDKECKAHGVRFSQHYTPLKCDECIAEGLGVIEQLEDIFLYNVYKDFAINTEKAECAGSCKMNIHYRYKVTHSGRSYSLPYGAKCGNCARIVRVTKTPEWLKDIIENRKAE